MRRRALMKWLALGILMPLETTQGQVPPDTLLASIGREVYVYDLASTRFALREIWQVANQQMVSTLVIDPRNGGLWGITAQGLTELHRVGSVLHFGQSIPLFFGYASATGAGFDDTGVLHLVSNGRIARVDVDRRLVLSESPGVAGFFVFYYEPPRAGRPAIANGYDNGLTNWRLVSLDENLNITHTFYSQPVPFLSPAQEMIVTTDAGETYVGSSTSLSNLTLRFARIDYQRGTLTRLSNAVGEPYVISMKYDGSRNLLYLAGLFNRNSPTVDRFAVYDLNTHRITHTDPFIASFSPHRPGWFPQNQLRHWPRAPVPAQPFTAHLALGGYPGELGMVFFPRALIASRLITSIARPIVIAPLNDSGVLPLPIPYDPALFPMNSGDALYFTGFLWDGSALRVTPEIEIAWE